ncbi:MAG: GTPase [Lachnospiraceae bacterium]|nr:GTPase [Lachnospiraceae bacterium]
MFKKKEVLVYLITGFLESGKTSFIKEVISEGQFADGKINLYLSCETGMEEVGNELLLQNNFKVREVESEEEITEEFFKKCDSYVRPARVLIEYNGTWDPNTVIEAFPDHWVLAEGIATVDATSFEQYLANMKQMMTRQFTYADLIIFNRADESTMNLAGYKRKARAVNRRSTVVFEMKDGTVNNDVKEELPYDLNSDVIEVTDEDYGIWYLDSFENPNTYEGKTVKFKGVVYKPEKAKPNVFIPGRFCMTCCEADITFYGYPCFYEGAPELKEKQVVEVTAKMDVAMSKTAGQDAPYLKAVSIEPADPPAEEVVYF